MPRSATRLGLLCGYEISTIYRQLRADPNYLIPFCIDMIMDITDFAYTFHIGPESTQLVQQDTQPGGLWMGLLVRTGLLEASMTDPEFNLRVVPQFVRLFEGVVQALEWTGITQRANADRTWEVHILHAWATRDRAALAQWVDTHLYPIRNPVFRPPRNVQAARLRVNEIRGILARRDLPERLDDLPCVDAQLVAECIALIERFNLEDAQPANGGGPDRGDAGEAGRGRGPARPGGVVGGGQQAPDHQMGELIQHAGRRLALHIQREDHYLRRWRKLIRMDAAGRRAGRRLRRVAAEDPYAGDQLVDG